MLGLFKRNQNNVTPETFQREVNDLKVRLDLVETDIKRLRKRSKIPEDVPDEEIIKSLEDDGFKEIRELQKKHGGTVLG